MILWPESCDEDDDELGVGVVEELVDVVFDRWSSGRYTHDPHRSSQEKEPREVSSRSITVTNKSNSLTYTVASSLVCTSPLAVITVVGFLDILMVSNSAELRSCLLTICIPVSESTTNYLSSGSFVDAAGSTHSSAGKWNVTLSLCILWQGSMPCFGHIAVVFLSLHGTGPQVS